MDVQKIIKFSLPPEWIERIFKRFDEIWSERFLNQFNSDKDFEIAKKQWQCGLYGLNAEQIRKGLDLCRSHYVQKPPHVVEFYHYCKGHKLPLPSKPTPPISTEQREIAGKYLKLIRDKLHGRIDSEGEATLSTLNQQILDKQNKSKSQSAHWQEN
jgi:hypothetical protein